jgi:hypothetical protein
MISESVRHYQDLLDRSGMEEGLSWTVIQPAGTPITVEEVMGRLGAERLGAPSHESDPLLVAWVRQVGSAVVMFQHFGVEGSRPEVLRLLSDGARVHNVEWTINGNGGVSCAIYGQVVVWIDMNDPERRMVTGPSVQEEELADLRQAKDMWEADDQSSAFVQKAASMALVEHRTGVRLTADLIKDLDSWQTVLLARIPSDPRPPGQFGHADPDLDARLRAAPEDVQRTALALALCAIADRFMLTDEALARTAIDAVEGGTTLDDETLTRVFRLGAHGDQGRLAAHAFYTAAAPADRWPDRFDALDAARQALPDAWPRLRRELSELISDRSETQD